MHSKNSTPKVSVSQAMGRNAHQVAKRLGIVVQPRASLPPPPPVKSLGNFNLEMQAFKWALYLTCK